MGGVWVGVMVEVGPVVPVIVGRPGVEAGGVEEPGLQAESISNTSSTIISERNARMGI
jgi:hypothetical protein